MAAHSSMLVGRIPWTEEPVRLQSMRSQRVRHDWARLTHTTQCAKAPHTSFPHSWMNVSFIPHTSLWSKHYDYPLFYKWENKGWERVSNLTEALQLGRSLWFQEFFQWPTLYNKTTFTWNSSGTLKTKHAKTRTKTNEPACCLMTLNKKTCVWVEFQQHFRKERSRSFSVFSTYYFCPPRSRLCFRWTSNLT